MSQPWKNAICKPGLCCIPLCPSIDCCKATCCPCVLYGQMREQLDGSSCLINCAMFFLCLPVCDACILGTRLRTDVRQKYGLDTSCGPDIVGAICCPCCSLLQVKAEMDDRGAPSGPIPQTM